MPSESAPLGVVALHLHAHLPYVRHPEYGDVLEEDWLFEALSETYLPLLEAFDRLADEGVPFRASVTLTPTLLAMLRDEPLMARYARRLDALCELGDQEVLRTRGDAAFHPLALHYQSELGGLRRLFRERYRGDLVAAFRRLAEAGRLELLTCAATHAFLPLLAGYPEAVRAQVRVAVDQHRRLLGRAPEGIWLPECGYYPGLDALLAEAGLRYFHLDDHGVTGAAPRPRHGVLAPILTPAGTAAFGRDPASSQQLWSAESGFPGDPDYREYYRDVGWDLDLEAVRPWLEPSGQRRNLGIKYHRITGRTAHKEPYVPGRARERAAAHAGRFLADRARQLELAAARMGGVPPIAVVPYDAERYGHWWYEAPRFLEELFRRVAAGEEALRLATPGDYLREHPGAEPAAPPLSSWGPGGYAGVWLDGSNEWAYRHLHLAAERMIALAREHRSPDPLTRRALNQAARELLLAQSSDWAFIMKTGTMIDYAVRRTREHVLRFTRLHDQLRAGQVDAAALAEVEAQDGLFPDLDYAVYAPILP
jgi:1,4-alpha-glucan branching enzyme